MAGELQSIDADDLIARANKWQIGERLPPDLLIFRESRESFAMSWDTRPLFARINNYSLVKAIVFVPDINPEVRRCALERCVQLAGAREVFSEIESFLKRSSKARLGPWASALKQYVKVKQISGRALFVRYETVPDQNTRMLMLSPVIVDLKTGNDIASIIQRYQEKHQYEFTEHIGGKVVKLVRTRIGNAGSFLVPGAGESRFLLTVIGSKFPLDHIKSLSRGKAGDVIVLEDLTNDMTVVYKIESVYNPGEALRDGAPKDKAKGGK